MMNIDQARAADPVVKMADASNDNGISILDPKKPKKHKEREDVSEAPGPTEPVFQAEERNLNIEVPQGWKVSGR
jgi:hypothetical protein